MGKEKMVTKIVIGKKQIQEIKRMEETETQETETDKMAKIRTRDKEIEIKIQTMIGCLEVGRIKKRIPHGVTKIQEIKRMDGTEIQETKKEKVDKIKIKDKEIEKKIPLGVTRVQEIKRMDGTEIQETKIDKVGKL